MEETNIINLYPEEDGFREIMLNYLEEYKTSYQRSLNGMINISEGKEHPRLKKMEKDLLIFSIEMQAFLIKANDTIPQYEFFINDFIKNVIFKEKDCLSSLIRKNDLTESLYEEYGKILFIRLKILNVWFRNNQTASETKQII